MNNNPVAGATITVFTIIAFVLIMGMIGYSSRSQQEREQEQEQARAQQEQLKNLDVAKAQEKLRMKLIQQMANEKLTIVLTSFNFRSGIDYSTSIPLDIEQGGMVPVPVLGKTTGDETLPEATEDENQHTEQNTEMRACDNGVVVGEPLPNNHNMNSGLDETLDAETEQDAQQRSNEGNPQAPDLESGTWSRADGSKRRSSLASIKESVKFILQKRRKSLRSTNRSSMQGEIFVTRAGKRLSICNECAICLDGYVPGDIIAFSGNVYCRHVFHQECILDYLVQRNNQKAPCPCCRQVFLPKE